MSADDLATALTTGASGWMVLSLSAVLPILWAFALAIHFGRPYVLRFLRTLTLRFGGDVWWLSYVLIRDGLLFITLGLSMIWALAVKLVRDADDDPGAYRIVSGLLVLASVLYIVPQVYGMEAADQEYLGDLPSKLISTSNLDVAKPIFWISIALFVLTAGALFTRFLVRLGRPADAASRSI
jgi:hypothetical protein